MNVYGPRQDYRGAYIAVIMKMLDAISRDEPLTVYGDGSQAYDFVYAGDCGLANVCAMKADTTDRFYNVGTGIKTTILELTKLLIEVTGAKSEIKYEPAGLTFVKNRIGSAKFGPARRSASTPPPRCPMASRCSPPGTATRSRSSRPCAASPAWSAGIPPSRSVRSSR